jgi:hypothetical protein
MVVERRLRYGRSWETAVSLVMIGTSNFKVTEKQEVQGFELQTIDAVYHKSDSSRRKTTTPRRRGSSIDPIAGSTNPFNLATGSLHILLAWCGPIRLPSNSSIQPLPMKTSVHGSINKRLK